MRHKRHDETDEQYLHEMKVEAACSRGKIMIAVLVFTLIYRTLS